MQPIDRSNAEHYIWGDVCEGWRLLKRDDMSIIAERVPPGAREKYHYHSIARQFFFILSGSAIIDINGERVILKEGQGIEVAPDTLHQFMNESSEDVHFLVISHPSTQGDRVEV